MTISKRVSTASLILGVALASTVPAWANDSTIPCKSPPKEGAGVAVHPGTQVTVTQDNQKSTCTFSINGAVATSPPAEQVMSALNLFRSGGALPRFDDTKTIAPAIAALLSAPAPVDKVPDELISALSRSQKELSGCLTEFFDKKGLPSVELKESRFICRGLRPYSDTREKHQLIDSGQPAVGVPTLVISVGWGGGRFLSALYLPLTITQMQPIPNR